VTLLSALVSLDWNPREWFFDTSETGEENSAIKTYLLYARVQSII
jgi:hypothetical protein